MVLRSCLPAWQKRAPIHLIRADEYGKRDVNHASPTGWTGGAAVSSPSKQRGAHERNRPATGAGRMVERGSRDAGARWPPMQARDRLPNVKRPVSPAWINCRDPAPSLALDPIFARGRLAAFLPGPAIWWSAAYAGPAPAVAAACSPGPFENLRRRAAVTANAGCLGPPAGGAQDAG